MTRVFFDFEDKEAAGKLAFLQGKPYLDKSLRELIGEKTCFGRTIHWERLEKDTGKKGRWYARWSEALRVYQQALKEQEAKFMSAKNELKQIRNSRARREAVTVEKLEDLMEYFANVESECLKALDLVEWVVGSVNYQVLKRSG